MKERSRGARRGPHSTGALLYDHMFDHNRLRRVRKQRRKERRKAGLPERKGSNVVQDPVTSSSSSRLGPRDRGFKSRNPDHVECLQRIFRHSIFNQVRYKHSDQKGEDALHPLLFGFRIRVAGLELGGGEAVKNMPVACFSARGNVPQPGPKSPEIARFRGILLFLCLFQRSNDIPISRSLTASKNTKGPSRRVLRKGPVVWKASNDYVTSIAWKKKVH